MKLYFIKKTFYWVSLLFMTTPLMYCEETDEPLSIYLEPVDLTLSEEDKSNITLTVRFNRPLSEKKFICFTIESNATIEVIGSSKIPDFRIVGSYGSTPRSTYDKGDYGIMAMAGVDHLDINLEVLDDLIQENEESIKIYLIDSWDQATKYVISKQNNATITLKTNERSPSGLASFKMDGLMYTSQRIVTGKANCDNNGAPYNIAIFRFDDFSLTFYPKSLPAVGTAETINYQVTPEGGILHVGLSYDAIWGIPNPIQFSYSVTEFNEEQRSYKINFTAEMRYFDGHLEKKFNLTDGVIQMNPYDFNACYP